MFASKIDWCEILKENYFEQIELISGDGTVAGYLADRNLDVVIGTDVVYWSSMIDPLINTLEKLCGHNTNLKIVICYIERQNLLSHSVLREKLSTRGFLLTELGQDVSKPINEHSYIYQITKQP